VATPSPVASDPTPRPTGTPRPTRSDDPTPEPSTPPSPTAAPATANPTPAATLRTYRVQSGDTLSAIATRFGTTVRAIVDLNNLADPNRLSVGQVLLIPS
jgi:LysM repeat protein